MITPIAVHKIEVVKRFSVEVENSPILFEILGTIQDAPKKNIPSASGIYIILGAQKDGTLIPLYVGMSINLKQRYSTQHVRRYLKDKYPNKTIYFAFAEIHGESSQIKQLEAKLIEELKPLLAATAYFMIGLNQIKGFVPQGDGIAHHSIFSKQEAIRLVMNGVI